jgi:seryl-tRNA synthetase
VIDLKALRQDPELFKTRLLSRNDSYGPLVDKLISLEQERRDLMNERSESEAKSNAIGKEVGQRMRTNPQDEGMEIRDLKEKGMTLKKFLAELSTQERTVEEQVNALALTVPNLPHASVPQGADEKENLEVRRWGNPRSFDFEPKPHWEVGEQLGILEVSRAVKIAQARFVALVGLGAKLERALANLMLDRHLDHGYVEVSPPLLVNSESLQGTGQLPKFAEDLFQCSEDDLWLIPTAEVPLTNLYRGEILDAAQLPIHHVAHTPCFRREAGSAGRDTRGLIRLHQFNKVEMVKITHPDTSYEEHEKLVQDAEAILQMLELPYRVVLLCTGDMGFSASKCYDLEVWLPGQKTYREISSCSNCEDFQARRAGIRFKDQNQKGTSFAHTLNGSGLAVGRTLVAILENYQNADGSLTIPTALRPYMGGLERI